MENFVCKGQLFFSTGPNGHRCIPDGFLVCTEGLCQGAFPVLPEAYRDLPLLDFGDRLILPGLVDLHLHGPQFAYRGLGMDLELLDWLNTHTFPEEAKFRDLAYAGPAYRQFVAALQGSFTTRAAIFATAHTEATLLLMDLLEESGLITRVGRVSMDRDCPEHLREPGPEAALEETRRWLEAVQGRYRRTGPILTPRFVPTCSAPLLEGLGRLARETGLPVQSHLSENQKEIAVVQERFPEASCYAQVYDRFGLLDTDCIMAHCVHSREAELALLKERGVFIAHSPESNSNLASGVAPVRRFLEQGLRVGLASDVAGGSSLNLFRAMAHAIQASKLRWQLLDQSLPPLTFDQVFWMATLGGGSFFGPVGTFAQGYAFDALILDDRRYPTVLPLSIQQRVERLVYLAEESCLTAKFVSGNSIQIKHWNPEGSHEKMVP